MQAFTNKSRYLALLILLCAACFPVQADEWHFSNVERVVSFGDVHGAYDALVVTLKNAGVIDEEAHWNGGRTHLVSTGDLLDRGAESRRVMDLMMRLEQEALRAGGRVHQLLGNHEVMNLNGDLRYVVEEEYAAFLDMETAAERESWYRHFRDRQPDDSDEEALRRAFDKKNPPGFFGHRRALRSDGRYGEWLLSKPFMIVINDVAYAHGGFPEFVAEYGLAGVNGSLKEDIAGFMRMAESLQEMGILSPADRFRQIPDVLTKRAEAGQLTGAALEAAVQLMEFGDSPLHGPEGPTWYRGTVACNALVEGDALQAALNKIGAARVVVGHTSTATRKVQQHMGGRVLEIDTGMLNEVYDGKGHALVIENGHASVVSQDGATDLVPTPHLRRIGHESLAIEESELEEILATGDIIDVPAVGARWKLLRVGSGDKTVLAAFREAPGKGNFLPELAAYRLDRLLKLGMVPATVRREIGGQDGTLQLVPAVTMTERERVARGRGKSPSCPMPKQMTAMFVFDALIHNVSRSPSSMLFEQENWLLMLVDHMDSFSLSGALPASAQGADLVVGDQWRTALLFINDKVLRRELGDVLDRERMTALRQRRDLLLELWNSD